MEKRPDLNQDIGNEQENWQRESIEILVDRLRAPEENARLQAEKALIEMGEAAAKRLSCPRFLFDPSPTVRLHIARFFVQYGGEQSIAPLLYLLRSEEQEICAAAETGLKNFGGDALKEMQSFRDKVDEDPGWRERIDHALSAMRESLVPDTGGKPVEVLYDETSRAREMDLIDETPLERKIKPPTKLGDEGLYGILTKPLRHPTAHRPGAGAASPPPKSVLSNDQPAEAGPEGDRRRMEESLRFTSAGGLIERLGSPDPHIRNEAIEGAHRLGRSITTRLCHEIEMRAGLAEFSADERRFLIAALDALDEIHDQNAAPVIRRVANCAPDDEVREKAARVLKKFRKA